MTRRGLLAAVAGLVPAAAVAAQRPGGVVGTRYEQPYTTTQALGFCPQCGRLLLVVDKPSERPAHDSAWLMSCRVCHGSWRIPVQRLEATRVEYVEPRG